MKPSSTADREINTTRVVNAPRDLVFKAFTDPENIGKWWGPNGFKTTTSRMEVKPGGWWIFIMHGPDGVNYDNRVRYIEVAAPERLVYEHGGGSDADPTFEVAFKATITFEEAGPGKTKVTLSSLFPSKEARDYVVEKVGAVEGAVQTLSRLAAYLES